jgi:hypothetical protein
MGGWYQPIPKHRDILIDGFQDPGDGEIVLELNGDLLVCESLEYGEYEL